MSYFNINTKLTKVSFKEDVLLTCISSFIAFIHKKKFKYTQMTSLFSVHAYSSSLCESAKHQSK